MPADPDERNRAHALERDLERDPERDTPRVAPEVGSAGLQAANGVLRAENDELRSRIALVETELQGLRTEALQRRAEVRDLAESLPTAVSRKTLLVQMANDVRHHPDKKRMAERAVRKLARGPRKLARIARDWFASVMAGA